MQMLTIALNGKKASLNISMLSRWSTLVNSVLINEFWTLVWLCRHMPKSYCKAIYSNSITTCPSCESKTQVLQNKHAKAKSVLCCIHRSALLQRYFAFQTLISPNYLSSFKCPNHWCTAAVIIIVSDKSIIWTVAFHIIQRVWNDLSMDCNS